MTKEMRSIHDFSSPLLQSFALIGRHIRHLLFHTVAPWKPISLLIFFPTAAIGFTVAIYIYIYIYIYMSSPLSCITINTLNTVILSY